MMTSIQMGSDLRSVALVTTKPLSTKNTETAKVPFQSTATGV
jgi:hypothetical protein